jgi:hypothetical protein
MKTTLRTAAIAAIIAVSAAGAGAAADEYAVNVGGADVAVVHAQIVHASRLACEAEYMRGAHRRADLDECIEATVDDAVARARRADLYAYHVGIASEQRYRDRRGTTLAAAE